MSYAAFLDEFPGQVRTDVIRLTGDGLDNALGYHYFPGTEGSRIVPPNGHIYRVFALATRAEQQGERFFDEDWGIALHLSTWRADQPWWRQYLPPFLGRTLHHKISSPPLRLTPTKQTRNTFSRAAALGGIAEIQHRLYCVGLGERVDDQAVKSTPGMSINQARELGYWS
jgi:hypothetical protein